MNTAAFWAVVLRTFRVQVGTHRGLTSRCREGGAAEDANDGLLRQLLPGAGSRNWFFLGGQMRKALLLRVYIRVPGVRNSQV